MAMRIVLVFSTAVISRGSDVCDGGQCEMPDQLAGSTLLSVKHMITKVSDKGGWLENGEQCKLPVHCKSGICIQHTCEAQGGRTTPAPQTTQCIGDASTYKTTWGTCDTYAFGEPNHNYCTSDSDSFGALAADVCPGCGCAGESSPPSNGSTGQYGSLLQGVQQALDKGGWLENGEQCKAPEHCKSGICIQHTCEAQGGRTTPAPQTTQCIGDASTYKTTWGTCDTYAFGEPNHNYCTSDSDSFGALAVDVCPGCGCAGESSPPSNGSTGQYGSLLQGVQQALGVEQA